MATFTNKATLSYNGISVESNTVTGNFNETLDITKTAVGGTYNYSSVITYVVSLVNSGVTAFSGVTVTDDLGGYVFGTDTVYPLEYVDGSILYYVNGVVQPAPTVTADSNLVVSGINVPAGENAVLIYQARVTEYAPLGTEGTLVNTATATGGGLAEAVSDSETVNTVDEPLLSISKALFPTSVNENGALTYTFDIENSGNTAAVATDNVVVTDTFDPAISITSVTLDGTVLTEGVDYTYNEATGEFATVAGVITVPEATYIQNADGTYTVIPGSVVLVVNGNL